MTTKTPTSQAELILLLAQQHLAFEQLHALEARVKTMAAQSFTSSIDYFTIAGYAALLHRPLTREQAVALGKQAAQLSRQLGAHIGKVIDVRFGKVGTYHRDILEQVFSQQRQ